MTIDRQTIAVVGGTGRHGSGLGYRFALGGHRVLIGSRDADRARHTAATLGARSDALAQLITGTTNTQAAAAADVVILALPWDCPAEDILAVATHVAGKIVVSCANPLGFDALGPHHVDIGFGSAAERLAQLLPGSRIVGAFHHLSALTLLDPEGDLSADDVLVCGDDPDAKAVVRRLCVAVTGRAGIDAGPLRMARQIEPFTAVLLSVNRLHRTRAALGLRHVGDVPVAG